MRLHATLGALVFVSACGDDIDLCNPEDGEVLFSALGTEDELTGRWAGAGNSDLIFDTPAKPAVFHAPNWVDQIADPNTYEFGCEVYKRPLVEGGTNRIDPRRDTTGTRAWTLESFETDVGQVVLLLRKDIGDGPASTFWNRLAFLRDGDAIRVSVYSSARSPSDDDLELVDEAELTRDQ